MAIGRKCDGGNEGLGFVRRTSSFGRKRIVILSDMFVDFPANIPTKKHCIDKSDFISENSMLEALPQDILIKILCGVDHGDLKRMFHVSKPIREATLIAKQWHFAYSTPRKAPAFRIFFDFQEPTEFDVVEAPNAPKQSRVPRSRLSKKKLADICVALFASSERDEGWPRRDLCMEMETEI